MHWGSWNIVLSRSSGVTLDCGGKFYPKEMVLGGTCADTRGATDCAEKFLAEYGASAMPQHCTCTDLQPQESLCKCDIICY
ncbi:hypothetical protein K1719_000697 [Acacia pycnantha]|nr:hypothetical protein K1719_000697 [Acacia pycnantha]